MEIKSEKLSTSTKVFGLSIWMLLFTYEGSFMVQSLFLFLIILMLYSYLKGKIKIKFESKVLIILFLFLCLSTIVNIFLYPVLVDEKCIIGIFYFGMITLWFLLNFNQSKNSREINFIINNYIYVMSIASLISIYYGVIVAQGGKIALINFIGTEVDENYSSALISTAVVILFLKLIFSMDNKKNTIKWLILFIINLVGVSIIGSRAAMLSCIISIIIGFLIYFSQKFTMKKMVIGAILILLGFCAFKIAINYMPDWTYDRYFKNSYVDKSNSIRITYWKNAINTVANSPAFGFGFGFYKKIPKHQNLEFFNITPESAPAHNTYLDILIYGGYIGFIIFIYFIYLILKKILNRKTIMLAPITINLIIISNIIGADRSVFFWNTLIILCLICDFLLKDENTQIEECFK